MLLLVAFLVAPVAAQADARLTKTTFRDTFTTDLDPAYWTTSKQGDTYIGTSLGRLQMFIPAEVTGNPFWAAAGSVPGFSTKADSKFRLGVDYNCPQWPQTSGIRLALIAYVHDKRGKVILTFQAGRLSDTDGSERYMVSMNGKTTYMKTSDTSGGLTIDLYHLGPLRFHVWAGRSDSAKFLLKAYQPRVEQVGKVTWGLSVWGHDYAHAKEPVRVDFGEFRLFSKKGFVHPKASDLRQLQRRR